MNELQSILKTFADVRDKYSDIQIAIKEVCVITGIDQKTVLNVLDLTGVYIIPGSKEDQAIRLFLESVDRTKCIEKELEREVAFRFCISSRESRRIVNEWLIVPQIRNRG